MPTVDEFMAAQAAVGRQIQIVASSVEHDDSAVNLCRVGPDGVPLWHLAVRFPKAAIRSLAPTDEVVSDYRHKSFVIADIEFADPAFQFLFDQQEKAVAAIHQMAQASSCGSGSKGCSCSGSASGASPAGRNYCTPVPSCFWPGTSTQWECGTMAPKGCCLGVWGC